MTTFRNPVADPWEPVADPLWSADPSLKTAVLIRRQLDSATVSRGAEIEKVKALSECPPSQLEIRGSIVSSQAASRVEPQPKANFGAYFWACDTHLVCSDLFVTFSQNNSTGCTAYRHCDNKNCRYGVLPPEQAPLRRAGQYQHLLSPVHHYHSLMLQSMINFFIVYCLSLLTTLKKYSHCWHFNTGKFLPFCIYWILVFENPTRPNYSVRT